MSIVVGSGGRGGGRGGVAAEVIGMEETRVPMGIVDCLFVITSHLSLRRGCWDLTRYAEVICSAYNVCIMFCDFAKRYMSMYRYFV